MWECWCPSRCVSGNGLPVLGVLCCNMPCCAAICCAVLCCGVHGWAVAWCGASMHVGGHLMLSSASLILSQAESLACCGLHVGWVLTEPEGMQMHCMASSAKPRRPPRRSHHICVQRFVWCMSAVVWWWWWSLRQSCLWQCIRARCCLHHASPQDASLVTHPASTPRGHDCHCNGNKRQHTAETRLASRQRESYIGVGGKQQQLRCCCQSRQQQ